jgi:RHS repeat-associated protein
VPINSFEFFDHTTSESYLFDRDNNPISNWISGSPSYNESYIGSWHFATAWFNAAHNASTLYFNYSDWLGTERMRTDLAGNVAESCASLPFGDGQNCTGALEVSPMHFTGKERDSESGLDNFGARYDSSNMGRFMSPDPLLNSGRLGNPQTLNRYAYALNNPLRIVDPTGLWVLDESAGGDMSDEDLQAIANDKHNKRHKWAQSALDFRDEFRDALDSANEAAGSSTLSDDQQSAAQAGVDAYGTENDSNGVIVGSNKGGFGATTLLNNNDTLTVMFGGSLRGDFLAATVAHEGVHVDQAQTWLAGGESSIGDLNHYAREQAAWTVGSSIAQALGMKTFAPHGGGSEYQVWNKGWKAADVQTLRSKGIANILNYSNLKPTDTDTYSNEHHQ